MPSKRERPTSPDQPPAHSKAPRHAPAPTPPAPPPESHDNDDEIAAPPTEQELAELAEFTDIPQRRFDALICDIDGCLVSEGPEPFDAGALRRIADHNRTAIKTGTLPVLTLCSGRPQPFVEAMARLLGNTLLPCIAENGVWLYYPATNEYLRDPSITREHIHAVHAAAEWVETELFPRGYSIQPGKSASVSIYHPDPALLEPVMPEIDAAFKKQGWPLRVTKTWAYINCDLEHISKATGLDWLIASAGLNPDRLAGFGDTQSDIPIAQRVRFFAAPPKHDPEIAPLAHHISPYWQAWAVLDVLERILVE